QVSISNQNVLQAEAQYREAKAGVRVARAALFPTLNASASIGASGNGGAGGVPGNGAGNGTTTASGTNVSNGASSGSGGTRGSFNLPFDVSWEPDIWGDIRRGVRASATTAQAMAADLENARLLYRAELAQDYFQLHGLDAQQDLLMRTESSYQEYLTLTR